MILKTPVYIVSLLFVSLCSLPACDSNPALPDGPLLGRWISLTPSLSDAGSCCDVVAELSRPETVSSSDVFVNLRVTEPKASPGDRNVFKTWSEVASVAESRDGVRMIVIKPNFAIDLTIRIVSDESLEIELVDYYGLSSSPIGLSKESS